MCGSCARGRWINDRGRIKEWAYTVTEIWEHCPLSHHVCEPGHRWIMSSRQQPRGGGVNFCAKNYSNIELDKPGFTTPPLTDR